MAARGRFVAVRHVVLHGGEGAGGEGFGSALGVGEATSSPLTMIGESLLEVGGEVRVLGAAGRAVFADLRPRF